MNTETNNLTAERSLEIIKKSIDDNRKEMVNSAGRPLLLWGSLVIVTSLICWYFTRGDHGNQWIHISWFVMAALGFTLEHYIKGPKKPHAVNVVGRTVGIVWFSFCCFALSFGAVSLFSNLIDSTFAGVVYFVSLYPIILVLMSFSCTITGFVLQNRTIAACGIIGGIMTIIESYFVVDDTGMLVLATVAIIELIIPGLILINQRNPK